MEPAKAIDDVIGLRLAGVLKAAGFKKSARTFRRALEGAIQVVNVQASQSNGPGARFTINLGVYRPEIAALVPALPVTEHPKEHECVVRERIGGLIGDGNDRWWEAFESGSSHNDVIAAEIADAVESRGLPWLDAHVSTQAIRLALSSHPNFVAAAAAAASGDIEGAVAIAEALAASRPAAATTARAWVKKLLATQPEA